MKAAYIEEAGPADAIRYGDLTAPQAAGRSVLVSVKAVAVNPIDTYVRSGMVKMELPRPFIVGCDLAGTVEAVGPDATRFKPGDRVWGSNQGLFGRQGTFAEYAAVEEQWLYPTPAGVSDQDAAALALVGITAHLGLVRDAALRAHEVLFVHGGSGGVGSCVVQIGKILGARVITTAGSDDKAEACRRLGADTVINYRRENVGDVLRKVAPDGVDVWFETLRQQDLEQAVGHLRMRGRLVLMAGRDSKPAFPVGPFYIKDGRVYGFAMFNAPPDEQRAAAEDINRWTADGRLRAAIGRVLPLAEAATAHRLQEDNTIHGQGTLAGKIVLVP